MARFDFISHPVIRSLLLICAWVPSSGAQALSPQTGDAVVEILRPLAVSNEQDLDFGRVIVAGEAGTIEIATDGTRTCSASLDCSGSVSPALFNVSGSGEWVGLNLNFDGNLIGPQGTKIPVALSLGETELAVVRDGTQVPVGARAEIVPGQPAGVYAAQFEITVSYQ